MTTLALVLLGYVALVLAVGALATRRAGTSPEEYFLAGRTLGPLVLFMALFGTNCTPFVMVGIPGRAYHDGLGQFGLNAPIIALVVPLTFWLIGVPARREAARLGALTPAELYARRLSSNAVGWVLFAVFTAYTVPYMVTGVLGIAVNLARATDGAVSEPVGAAAVLLVALAYTTLGGMRATAWTNVVQGTLFLLFMVAALVGITHALGGLEAAFARVRTVDPSLLTLAPERALFRPGAWTSYALLISLTVIAFPHMLVRLLAAKDEAALKGAIRLYPIALVALWLPAVLLGVFGAAEHPGLEGAASDGIFAVMIAEHLPAFFSSLGLLALLASVMSTLDAQILTLGSMLTRDVVDRVRGDRDDRADVRAGRWFGAIVTVAVFLLAEVCRRAEIAIFDIARFAFAGFCTLVPTLLFGVRWRRFDARAAIGSIAAGNAVLGLGEAGLLPSSPFQPVFWGFAASLAAALALGAVGRRPAGTGG